MFIRIQCNWYLLLIRHDTVNSCYGLYLSWKYKGAAFTGRKTYWVTLNHNASLVLSTTYYHFFQDSLSTVLKLFVQLCWFKLSLADLTSLSALQNGLFFSNLSKLTLRFLKFVWIFGELFLFDICGCTLAFVFCFLLSLNCDIWLLMICMPWNSFAEIRTVLFGS